MAGRRRVTKQRIRTPGEKARRCEEILDAAARFFAEEGYLDADIEVLARRLELGKGTIYRAFPSKRELFLAAVDGGVRRMRAAVDAAVRSAASPLEQIAGAVRAYLAFFREHPELVELLVIERAEFKERKPPTYFANREARLARWRALYRDLVRSGLARPAPAERVTSVLGDLLYGTMFTNYFAGRRKSVASQAEDVLDIFFHGILTEKGLAAWKAARARRAGS
jgi:AcrR family transcriptional regulator